MHCRKVATNESSSCAGGGSSYGAGGEEVRRAFTSVSSSSSIVSLPILPLSPTAPPTLADSADCCAVVKIRRRYRRRERTTVIVVIVTVDDSPELLPLLLRLLRVRPPCPRERTRLLMVGWDIPRARQVRHYPEVEARVLSSWARLLRLGLLCQRPSFVNRRVTNYLCFIFARGSCVDAAVSFVWSRQHRAPCSLFCLGSTFCCCACLPSSQPPLRLYTHDMRKEEVSIGKVRTNIWELRQGLTIV